MPSMTAVHEFVARIHASGMHLVLGVTGGGSQAISMLLGVPGGSRSVLAAVVPYSAAALAEWLRSRPEHFCSEHTARLMAMAAYQQALRLAAAEGGVAPVAGVACTASLVSDRPKHGAHRVHVAAQTAGFTAVASLELTKGARDRHAEEDLAARFLLNMVAQGCGLTDRLPLARHAPECVVENGTVAPAAWKALFAGENNHVLATPPGAENECAATAATTADAARPKIVFPGAFHPLHAAHRAMAEIAASRLGAPVDWEISIANVDKPPLDFHEMRFAARHSRRPIPRSPRCGSGSRARRPLSRRPRSFPALPSWSVPTRWNALHNHAITAATRRLARPPSRRSLPRAAGSWCSAAKWRAASTPWPICDCRQRCGRSATKSAKQTFTRTFRRPSCAGLSPPMIDQAKSSRIASPRAIGNGRPNGSCNSVAGEIPIAWYSVANRSGGRTMLSFGWPPIASEAPCT